MIKEQYKIIGLMSGTSLDGIDLAHIQLTIKEKRYSFEILETATIPYSSSWVHILKEAVSYSSEDLEKLNQDYTELLASTILDFVADHKIINLDAVCSHGHTILHQPQNGLTLQIGNLLQLASLINQTVVCDFRVQDVALGGQGAPLVPIGDRLLFSDYDYCMNLGGFSNISFEKEGKRLAFDISPVNTVLNFYANQLGLDYDDRGKIAKKGSLNTDLLKQLNDLDFYKKTAPKSLGVEFVLEIILPLIENHTIPIEDKLHTFTEHVAIQISLAIPKQNGSLFITGGGAYNDFLIERIQKYLPEMRVLIPNNKVLEYKEALIFALLGVLKLRDEINVLSSVTGARHDHSSGKVYYSN